MPKLNQIIAVEGGSRKLAEDAVTQAYRLAEKAELFAGLSRSYQPLDDEGETMPSEMQLPQVTAAQLFENFAQSQMKVVDLTATKVTANQRAKADVVVDGKTVVKDAPVELLLFLERRIGDVILFVKRVPTLDPTQRWEFDEADGFYKSAPVQTNRNLKRLQNHVKAPATDKHAAQVETYTEEYKVGTWTKANFSGAITATRKAELLERAGILLDAVKKAREEANSIDAPDVKVATKVFDYLFGE